MAKLKQFKTESQKVLDLMINSIYTNKEIFLREYISNASDAMDKLYAKKLDDGSIQFEKEDLKIEINLNPQLRLITIKDYGIGMNKEELELNLGTIAHSDSQQFKDATDLDIIGQFGVGFYSGFMVAKEIRVISKSYTGEPAYGFFSNGIDGYKIESVEKTDRGTEIFIFLKEGEEYDPFNDEATLRQLVKKYSDYIRYPILMKDDNNEIQTLNKMTPIWKQSKNEITQQQYDDFYMSHFHDYQPPRHTIHMNVEGTTSFTALLFIPAHTPFNYYTNDYKKGLELYSRSVFIESEIDHLLSSGFSFIKGIVDSSDLNLNISRETLQNDAQLKQIARRIHRKIKTELEHLLKEEREKYLEIYQDFSLSLKYGCYDQFGSQKAEYQDLLMFNTSKDDQLYTLAEVVSRMDENQKEIPYLCAASLEKAKTLPVYETYQEKGIEVLFLLNDIDEFAIKMIGRYQEKPFKAINQGDFDQDDEEIKTLTQQHQGLLDQFKANLADKVVNVRLTNRLKSHPVVLVADEGISFEMERVLSNSPDANSHVKAARILELNPHHPLFERLTKLDDEMLAKYALILYNQACLIENLPLDDLSQFTQLISELMLK